MKVAIVGSRKWPYRAAVSFCVQGIAREHPGAVIVSGGAEGVDKVAEETARVCGLEVELHLPDWKAHGRAAGPLRNRLIVESADRVVAFWDGESRGTLSSINIAKKLGKPLEVITPADYLAGEKARYDTHTAPDPSGTS